MVRKSFRRRLVLLTGVVFAFNVSSIVPDGCQEYARMLNPGAGAGDVFTEQVLNEADWLDFFDGFAPNYDRDPFCTLPQTCPGTTTYDPYAGDDRPGLPSGTTITTTTTAKN